MRHLTLIILGKSFLRVRFVFLGLWVVLQFGGCASVSQGELLKLRALNMSIQGDDRLVQCIDRWGYQVAEIRCRGIQNESI
jgi:hypothetical protein